ncbi:hypothetical protein G7Y89_g7418 [Cudoniella acicularis]|uniref:Actin-like ATPase domain-containing protein n=1 Tax=Cudoniella acicularis TaxID=354080 RepID=A0A8H4RII1_9HELO|nr:hypothetical protein G7Y89_g7418 [Cudoniella acicularis]
MAHMASLSRRLNRLTETFHIDLSEKQNVEPALPLLHRRPRFSDQPKPSRTWGSAEQKHNRGEITRLTSEPQMGGDPSFRASLREVHLVIRLRFRRYPLPGTQTEELLHLPQTMKKIFGRHRKRDSIVSVGKQDQKKRLSIPNAPIHDPRNEKPTPFSQVAKEEEDDEETSISISIDLGTTFSGIAWALSTSPKNINPISSWDSDLPLNSDLHKVPSVLTYNSKGEVTSWGYKLDADRHPLSWFKLLLSEAASEKLAKEQFERYQALQTLLQRFDKDPVQVVADYLRCLWSHATGIIQDAVGVFVWENVSLKITITVPAIWDHTAQELTKQAAEIAGLLKRRGTVLVLVGEPEAAAMAVFEEMTPLERKRFKVGDGFVVCDAGGGTVVSGMCGAIFLDRAFEKQVRTMITVGDYEALSGQAKGKLMNDWEHGIKRNFTIDAPEDKEWHLHIQGYLGVHGPDFTAEQPDNGSLEIPSADFAPGEVPGPDFQREIARLRIAHLNSRASVLNLDNLNRLEPGSLVLQTGHLNAMFSEVCSKIKDLVGTQLSAVEAKKGKRPVAIFLVGGFGGNKYLKQEMVRSFPGVEIRQPPRAQTAICRGAVLRGFRSDFVVNHISKYNYGVVHEARFIEGHHNIQDKKYDRYLEAWYAKNQIKWFLKRGDDVDKNEAVKQTYWRTVHARTDIMNFPVIIYFSHSEEAETRKSEEVQPLCKLVISVDERIYDELPVRKNKEGVAFRELDYVLEMRVSSGELCWLATRKGVECGTVKNAIAFEGIVGG